MSTVSFFDETHAHVLSATLKAVRRVRGLRATETADALGMPLRSYEYFEGGEGKFDFLKVFQFARVTDTDPFAILAAIQLGDPEFAARSADNKLMMLNYMSVGDLSGELGPDLAILDSAFILAEFTETRRRLVAEVHRRQSLANAAAPVSDDDRPAPDVEDGTPGPT